MACFKGEKFTITISTPLGRHKIIKIIFNKKDGSIHLSFPYFRDSKGLLSIGTLPQGETTAQIKLEKRGKITSHLVKYSHHPDGTVLFSQDRKIFSKIRKKSKALADDPGHIFTVQLQGLSGFESFAQSPAKDGQTAKERILNFHFAKGEPEATKLLAYWHTKKYVISEQDHEISKPTAYVKDKSGAVRPSFLISPLEGNLSAHSILMLMAEAIPKMSHEIESLLVFIGGFDPNAVADDLSRKTDFLAFQYPAVNYEDLKNRIGSIDFIEE